MTIAPGRSARGISVMLAGCVLAYSSGCATAWRPAVESNEAIALGMTKSEVVAAIGEPSNSWASWGEGPGSETWLYRFEAETVSPFEVILGVLGVILIVGLVVLLIAAGGGGGGSIGGGWGGGGGGGDDDPSIYEFELRFGPDGRVREIGEVQAGN